LAELDYNNVKIVVRDGSMGWEENAPYDAIMVTASCPGRPKTLLSQLGEGGRLIAPIGSAFGQVLTLFKKQNNSIISQDICGCVFVPLLGKEGWNE
jgi:protein-L-isoaspartate(D-aspartate) O-methyltransferase